MKITNEIKEVLEAGSFEGNVFKLPNIQLDRKLYKQVNEILETLGGKWKTRVGHIFDGEQEDLENALQEVLENGETETLKEIKKRFQFYPTPEIIARELVKLADLKKDDRILEPSAGKGAIINELPNFSDITAVELFEENFEILKEKYKNFEKVKIYNQDFLKSPFGVCDKIIMNPPFAKNQDVKHILKAYSLLEKGGKLVTIAPSNLLDKNTKLHQELKETGIYKERDLGVEAFKESGVNINTAIYIINK